MKKILRYLSVKQLMEDIADLNGVMSVRRFVLSTMLAGVAVYSACLLYRINYIAALFGCNYDSRTGKELFYGKK